MNLIKEKIFNFKIYMVWRGDSSVRYRRVSIHHPIFPWVFGLVLWVVFGGVGVLGMGISVQVRYSEGGRGLRGLGLDLVEPVLAVEVVMCWF